MQEQHKTSFIGGFSLGLLAGATGFFLFATDRGKQVRQKINLVWQEASEDLSAQGFIDDPQESLRDFLQKTLTKCWQQIEQPVVKSDKTSKKLLASKQTNSKKTTSLAKTSSSNKPTTKKKELKFRGV